ncbi:FG-GAP repeat domain-containing protein [Sporobolomyces koalae]|uniref:FG-GAP repeat domain-containing protein n=1 Tax=Sporobolomyces koalae TaxID=500713 RepID=UPI0031783771
MLSSIPFALAVVIAWGGGRAHAWSLASFNLSSLFPAPHRFPQERLLDLASLGLPKTGSIAAIGDYNADQLNDVFHLSYDQRSVSVWTWDRKSYTWHEDERTRIKTPADFVVTNVLPGDFNRDGKLDLLLMAQKNPSSDPNGGWIKDKETRMAVYLQQPDGTYSLPYHLDSATLAQPIPLDATGTMMTSLLGFTPSSESNPQLWLNTASPVPSNDSTSLFTLTDAGDASFDFSSHPTGQWTCQFPTPHSNAFLDLDGDCLADLFFTCIDPQDSSRLEYQIWTNDKTSGKFVWKRQGQLPKGTKNVGFADMDRDGTIDMILSVCPNHNNNKDCSIQIAYNDQIPLCTSTSTAEEECRDIEDLCVADPNFNFNLTDFPDNGSLTKISVASLFPSHNLVTSSHSFRGLLPTPPRPGDYNIDGYPDLLLLVSPQARSSHRLAKLVKSVPCGEDEKEGKCTRAQIDKKRRAYQVEEKGVEELEKFQDVETVSWLDLDDDGSLDIVVQRTGQSGAARQINFVKNNFFNDAFFLKATVLNGACKNWCEPREPGQSRYRPYGSSYSGASFKFTVLDPTGARRSTQYAQLAQTSYMSLALPYAHLGLGRTNNYVENLFIGSTRKSQPIHYINLEGVIPNSQVLILPFQTKEGKEHGDVAEWKKELYLKPGDWIPWVTAVLLTAIVGLGVVVLVLHLNEKREDEVEKRARLLSLNFQAL